MLKKFLKRRNKSRFLLFILFSTFYFTHFFGWLCDYLFVNYSKLNFVYFSLFVIVIEWGMICRTQKISQKKYIGDIFHKINIHRRREINQLITHNNSLSNFHSCQLTTIIRIPIYRLDDSVNKSYNHRKCSNKLPIPNYYNLTPIKLLKTWLKHC